MEAGYHVQNGIVVNDANDAVHDDLAFTWPFPQSAIGPQDVLPLTDDFPESLETFGALDSLVRYQNDPFDILVRFSIRFNDDTEYSNSLSNAFKILSPQKLSLVKNDLQDERQIGDGYEYTYAPIKYDKDGNRQVIESTQDAVLDRFRASGAHVAYQDSSRVYIVGEHNEETSQDSPPDYLKTDVTYHAKLVRLMLRDAITSGQRQTFFLEYFQLRRFFTSAFKHPDFNDPLVLYTGQDTGQRRKALLNTIRCMTTHLKFSTMALQDLATYRLQFSRTLRDSDSLLLPAIVNLVKPGDNRTVLSKVLFAKEKEYAYQNVHATLWHLMTGKNPFYEEDLGRSEMFICRKDREKVVYLDTNVRDQFDTLRDYNPLMSELSNPYLQSTLNLVYRGLLVLANPAAFFPEPSERLKEELSKVTWPDMRIHAALDLLSGLVFARRVESPLNLVQLLHQNLNAVFGPIRFGLSGSVITCTRNTSLVDLSLMPLVGFCLYYKKFTAEELNPNVFNDQISRVLPVAFEPSLASYPLNLKEFHLRFQYFLQAVLQTYEVEFDALPDLVSQSVVRGPKSVYPLSQNEVRPGFRPLSLASSKSMRTWYACVFKYLSPFQLHLLSVFNTIFSPGTLKIHKLQTSSILEGSIYGTESIGTVMRKFLPEGPVIAFPIQQQVLAAADVNAFDAFLNQLAEQPTPESPPDVLPPLELAPDDEAPAGLPWAVQVAAKGPKAAKAAAMDEVLDVIPAQDFEDEEEPPIFVGNLVRPRRRFAGPLPVSRNLDIRPFFEAPL